MPTPIIPGFTLAERAWGITEEPRTTEYFATYLAALGSDLREDMVLLDYGCGCGRLANYLSANLERFTYWGIEPPSDFGRASIEYGRHLFGHDPRVNFAVAGELDELEAIDKADAAILSSVFTHLAFWTFEEIMLHLEPIWRRGTVAFSCFLAQTPRLEHAGLFGPGTYGHSFYALPQLQEFARDHSMQLTEEARVFVDFEHVIFQARGTSDAPSA